MQKNKNQTCETPSDLREVGEIGFILCRWTPWSSRLLILPPPGWGLDGFYKGVQGVRLQALCRLQVGGFKLGVEGLL